MVYIITGSVAECKARDSPCSSSLSAKYKIFVPYTKIPTDMSRPPSPSLGKGYFSVPFERFVRDDKFDQLASAFTLLGPFFLPFYSDVAPYLPNCRHYRNLLRFPCRPPTAQTTKAQR